MTNNVSFDLTSKLFSALLDDVAFLVFDVVEVFPEGSFNCGVLVLHECSHFAFMDCIRVRDNTIAHGASIGEVFRNLSTKLFALDTCLIILLFRSTNVRHLVTDSGSKNVKLLAGNKRINFGSHSKSPYKLMAGLSCLDCGQTNGFVRPPSPDWRLRGI